MGNMAEDYSNIVLIGMPGAGKSTVGVILAKQTSRDFVDTDVLIQTLQGRSLQQILDAEGYLALRKIEEEALLNLRLRNHVIATGGSAAYSDRAMTHLKSNGVIVFLNVDLATLEARIGDFDTRGVAKRPDQSFAELFQERYTLYTNYADITIQCNDLTHEEVCDRIIHEIERRRAC
jgi:shikimate kinase